MSCREAGSPVSGEVEESCFDVYHVKGARGRGARRKSSFSAYSNVIAFTQELFQTVLRYPARHYPWPREPESMIHSDGWRYDGFMDMGCQKHFRIEHGKNEFANNQLHNNGIESFWLLPKPGTLQGSAKTYFLFSLEGM